jgi:hypothetical protein
VACYAQRFARLCYRYRRARMKSSSKTDFGFILIEKSKIASIVPMASEAETKPASKKQSRSEAAKQATEEIRTGASNVQPTAEPAVESSKEPSAAPNYGGEPVNPGVESQYEKPAPKITNTAVRPELPALSAKANPVAPALKGALSGTPALAASVTPPPPPEPELPAVREEVQGNVYTNYTHGFRMYKAPSWQLIDDARTTLPNAIVAMGTFNESTLMVVGQEKSKQSLDASATMVEKRLRDVYEDYQQISQQKIVVGGLPAVEFHYRGKADEHDWSGTLVVVARGTDVFTALGMTRGDSDLIQIQENVIARAIASLDFSVR